MKKFFKKAEEILKNEPAHIRTSVWVIFALFFFLFAWLIGLIAVAIVRNIEMISGLLLLFFLYCGESLVNYWKNRKRHNDQTCTGCGGCANYYPAIRATMFTALRQSAAALSLRPPETENMIVSAVQQTTDTLPRFTFKAVKSSPEPSELSSAVRISLLQAAVNDSFASFQDSFIGSKITGLYIEEIREQNLYTDVISVIPVCGFTSPYIEKRESERYRRENNKAFHAEDEVFDDEF